MKTADFDYYLPKELIAQEPVTPRDSSRLMVVDRKNGIIQHKFFRDISEFLNEGDLLVINDAKVFPARLLGKKEETGGKVDLLLVDPALCSEKHVFTKGGVLWKCLIQGRIRKGLNIVFGNNKLKGRVEDYDKGIYLVNFEYDGNFNDVLKKIGEMPLPPYIKRASESSKKRYQTVYAKKDGAIAAPTAGFHFTKGLLDKLKSKGISVATITLIVGRGTFNPIKTETIEKHEMDEEYFEIEEKEREKINNQLAKGGRIVAVGTTSVRALESAFANGKINKNMGKTSLFIYPGYKFKTVDSLITNFHLPKSTPLLLTSAFAGRELIMRAYKEAIDKKCRFYSFGDAMLIL
jgi:S-adenosylmethionine:tRNA ribosyltransferase-isomerase